MRDRLRLAPDLPSDKLRLSRDQGAGDVAAGPRSASDKLLSMRIPPRVLLRLAPDLPSDKLPPNGTLVPGPRSPIG